VRNRSGQVGDIVSIVDEKEAHRRGLLGLPLLSRKMVGVVLLPNMELSVMERDTSGFQSIGTRCCVTICRLRRSSTSCVI
jgi:hypothetical protein